MDPGPASPRAVSTRCNHPLCPRFWVLWGCALVREKVACAMVILGWSFPHPPDSPHCCSFPSRFCPALDEPQQEGFPTGVCFNGVTEVITRVTPEAEGALAAAVHPSTSAIADPWKKQAKGGTQNEGEGIWPSCLEQKLGWRVPGVVVGRRGVVAV